MTAPAGMVITQEATMSRYHPQVRGRHAAGKASTHDRTDGDVLHAGVTAARHARQKPERLCRYINRPAIAGRARPETDGFRCRSQVNHQNRPQPPQGLPRRGRIDKWHRAPK